MVTSRYVPKERGSFPNMYLIVYLEEKHLPCQNETNWGSSFLPRAWLSDLTFRLLQSKRGHELQPLPVRRGTRDNALSSCYLVRREMTKDESQRHLVSELRKRAMSGSRYRGPTECIRSLVKDKASKEGVFACTFSNMASKTIAPACTWCQEK